MLFEVENTTEITHKQCEEMLTKWLDNHYDKSIPCEQFWFCCKDENETVWYEVIDNRDYGFFMECFKSPEAAHAWLRGVDVDVCYKIEKILVEAKEAEESAYREYEDRLCEDYM